MILIFLNQDQESRIKMENYYEARFTGSGAAGAPDNGCGHKHRTAKAARACGEKKWRWGNTLIYKMEKIHFSDGTTGWEPVERNA